ncbi:MAG: C1 domain-containing protein [Promethearchaeota archaeon]
MEEFGNFIASNEKILWKKHLYIGKKREKTYLITDKRIYFKSNNVPELDISFASKEYISIKVNVLIIERKGIKYTTWKGNSTFLIFLKDSPEKPYLEIGSLSGSEFGEVKDILIKPFDILKADEKTSSENNNYIQVYVDSINQSQISSKIIPIENNNYPYGESCQYCNHLIESIREMIYSCENCKAYYHISCLNIVLQTGNCLKCDSSLYW